MYPLLSVKEKYKFQLISIPGVVSVGIGYKSVNKKDTKQLAIVVGVEKKLTRTEVDQQGMIPEYLDGIPTDVVEIGKIILGDSNKRAIEDQSTDMEVTDIRKSKVRPAPPGVSISHFRVSSGTFGAVVKGSFPGGIAILSNNHVIANNTNGLDTRAAIGDIILQPGWLYGGRDNEVIARLAAFSPILWIPSEKYGPGVPINLIDAALAIPLKPFLVTDLILGLGPVLGVTDAVIGMHVFKSGASTGVTDGYIRQVHAFVVVRSRLDETITALFDDQIISERISRPGDSGSLVLDSFGRAVGLIFAASENQSFFNPIKYVLKTFNVGF
ncbi:chymotrypsin family serine protease [Alkaliphilus transvaalensis]|uniref:hypothetical protein n=1 Tax=Alkaliphilus transvaalensis TaxID=114628 RepID=UPI000478A1FB|nr:hypothetical protein [Alkaliphilus transvaalensis]